MRIIREKKGWPPVQTLSISRRPHTHLLKAVHRTGACGARHNPPSTHTSRLSPGLLRRLSAQARPFLSSSQGTQRAPSRLASPPATADISACPAPAACYTHPMTNRKGRQRTRDPDAPSRPPKLHENPAAIAMSGPSGRSREQNYLNGMVLEKALGGGGAGGGSMAGGGAGSSGGVAPSWPSPGLKRPLSSRIMGALGKLFIELIPAWVAAGTMLFLIFGGCCSNVGAPLAPRW